MYGTAIIRTITTVIINICSRLKVLVCESGGVCCGPHSVLPARGKHLACEFICARSEFAHCSVLGWRDCPPRTASYEHSNITHA